MPFLEEKPDLAKIMSNRYLGLSLSEWEAERPDVANIISILYLGKHLSEWEEERNEILNRIQIEEKEKTKERARDKEKILCLHFECNVKPGDIARAFQEDPAYIKALIKEAKKQGWQLPKANNGKKTSK